VVGRGEYAAMTNGRAFLAGFAVAAAAACGAWWFVVRPRVEGLDARVVTAERAALRAKRDASDSQQWADRERRRKLELEEEATGLKKLLSAAPPPAPMAPHGAAPRADDGLAPEKWDDARVRQEIQLLSMSPNRIVGNPKYPLVVRALKTKPDASVALLTDAMAQPLDDGMHSVCAVLFGALGDARGVEPLLARWRTAADPVLRRAILRGLANLPGDAATPLLVATWNDSAAEPTTRNVALYGLARRRHEIAIAVAEGAGVPGATRFLRYTALSALEAQAARAEWKDATLAPVFGKALRTADGDPQREIALRALEGFWSPDSVADLDAFATSAGQSELAARARRDAEAIRAGKPRPTAASGPASTQAAAVPGEPEDAPPETKAPPVK
jgi:hypothetical protein